MVRVNYGAGLPLKKYKKIKKQQKTIALKLALTLYDMKNNHAAFTKRVHRLVSNIMPSQQ